MLKHSNYDYLKNESAIVLFASTLILTIQYASLRKVDIRPLRANRAIFYLEEKDDVVGHLLKKVFLTYSPHVPSTKGLHMCRLYYTYILSKNVIF